MKHRDSPPYWKPNFKAQWSTETALPTESQTLMHDGTWSRQEPLRARLGASPEISPESNSVQTLCYKSLPGETINLQSSGYKHIKDSKNAYLLWHRQHEANFQGNPILQATKRYLNNSETVKKNEKWYERWSNLSSVAVFSACRKNWVQETRESGGGRPGLPVPNGPCGRKATLNLNYKLRSPCAYVDMHTCKERKKEKRPH